MLKGGEYVGIGPTAGLPDGRTIVVLSNGMFALLPSGEIDPDFGEGGMARIVEPEGSTHTYVGSVAIDPQGRIVLSATSSFEPGAPFQPGPNLFGPPRHMVIERLTPGGKPDPSFSGDGVLVTDFGLSPPAVPDFPELEPIVVGQGVSVDAQGRTVVTGARTQGLSCVPNKGGVLQYPEYEAFVARLQSEGTPDVSFGDAGKIALGTIDGIGQPMPDAGSGIFLTAYINTSCHRSLGSLLIHLNADGGPDGSFGLGGRRPLPTAGVRSMTPKALDSAGRILLTGYLWGSRNSGVPNKIMIRRLEPDGSLDRSFGLNGTALVPKARLGSDLLTIDESGNILVAANLRGRRESRKRVARPPGILLARMRPNGVLDRRFGGDGTVAIRLGRHRGVNLSALNLVAHDRVLVGGYWKSLQTRRPGHGFVFARFELGS